MRDQPCNRCGRPAETMLSGALLHGGTPYCYRCVVEVQLDHALERAAKIPELEARLVELGGPAERIVCGHVYYTMTGDPTKLGSFCWGTKGHEGNHIPEPPLELLTH